MNRHLPVPPDAVARLKMLEEVHSRLRLEDKSNEMGQLQEHATPTTAHVVSDD